MAQSLALSSSKVGGGSGGGGGGGGGGGARQETQASKLTTARAILDRDISPEKIEVA